MVVVDGDDDGGGAPAVTVVHSGPGLNLSVPKFKFGKRTISIFFSNV